MSRYNRQKGHSFEREIAADFRDLGFKDAKTTRQARGGDWSKTDDGVDLVNTGPFAVQCKRLAQYVSVNTIEEIILSDEVYGIRGMNPDNGELIFDQQIPVVLTAANRKRTVAILYWDDLKALIEKLHKPDSRTVKDSPEAP